jgi:hypothetical protein
MFRKAFQPFPSTSRFQYLVTGILKHRSYNRSGPESSSTTKIVSGASRFIIRESGNSIATSRRGRRTSKHSICLSKAVTMISIAHLAFTSYAENAEIDLGGGRVVLKRTFTFRETNSRLLRMELCWRLLPSSTCGGEDYTRYSYTPTSIATRRPLTVAMICSCGSTPLPEAKDFACPFHYEQVGVMGSRRSGALSIDETARGLLNLRQRPV